jgi:hypothetical protein
MTSKNIYTRKISSKEAEEGFIFILKNKLNFFPTLGTVFKLQHDGLITEAEVESYPCTCRGPERPHEHYFIQFNGLIKDDTVKIYKDEKHYRIEIN